MNIIIGQVEIYGLSCMHGSFAFNVTSLFFLHEHSHLSSEITRGIVHNNLYIDRVLISLAYC